MKKIFFAYSDNAKDIELYKEFNKHFKNYARNGMLMIIDKDELFRVNNDNEKVLEFLKQADITIPLLSIDYLNSDQCIKILEAASSGNKQIIPVLLRDCDYAEIEKLKGLEKNLLPEDKEPVTEHISKNEGPDEIFTAIARKVKGIIFKELEAVHLKKGSNLFYYILAGIVFLIGGLAAVYSYSKWGDWIISVIIFLMFGVAALFALKNVLFPTKFKAT